MNDELYHHGIKGQKWGIRRYQNPDGSLTLAGRKRYGGERAQTYRERELDTWNTRRANAIVRGRTREANIANRQMTALRRMSEEQLAAEAMRIDNAIPRGVRYAAIISGATLLAASQLLGFGGGFAGGAVAGAVAGGIQGTATAVSRRRAEQERIEQFASNYRDIPISRMR